MNVCYFKNCSTLGYHCGTIVAFYAEVFLKKLLIIFLCTSVNVRYFENCSTLEYHYGTIDAFYAEVISKKLLIILKIIV